MARNSASERELTTVKPTKPYLSILTETWNKALPAMDAHKTPDEFPIVPEEPPTPQPNEIPVPDQDPGVGDPLPTEMPPIKEPPGIEPAGP